MTNSSLTAELPPTRADRVMLAIALVLPTVVTWHYFVALADQPTAAQQWAYGVGKVVQFSLPVLWVWLALGRKPRLVWPGLRGVELGLIFGMSVLGAMTCFYYGGLKPAGLFEGPTQEVRQKVASFGIHSAASYIALASFYSLAHSLLEEYYWRWFVFGHCCRGLPPATAIGLSSVGFAAHHVLVLGTYFGYDSPLTWLFIAGIVVGGACWAWLYRRSGSLLGPWLSHALVDATIFVIGWDLVQLGSA
jgi:membrane protease YdiL (CAAX protease family)